MNAAAGPLLAPPFGFGVVLRISASHGSLHFVLTRLMDVARLAMAVTIRVAWQENWLQRGGKELRV